MAVAPQYLAYVLEQLRPVGALSSRRMFGAVGLYSGELFFGLIDDDTLFFKTDASNHAEYRARNMPRFMPFPDRPDAVMAYHQVPSDTIEDGEELVGWARRSVAVALAVRAAKKPRKEKGKDKADTRTKLKPKRKAGAGAKSKSKSKRNSKRNSKRRLATKRALEAKRAPKAKRKPTC